jgi:predicted dehydrogenase
MNPDQAAGRPDVSRRQFLQTAAVAGAGLVLSQAAQAAPEFPAPQEAAGDELALGVVGVGSQGRILLQRCVKIPGVRFVAVCDIWPYHQQYAANILKKYDQAVSVYEDYREMLAKEKQLDAVIVATPDWKHAEITIAALNAGKHVYCEKEMSNSLEEARQMVLTARQTGKLLQIGHQRRSNPRYWHALKLIEKDKVLGRITHFYGQWNRPRLYEIGFPPGKELADDALKRHGYDTMERFCNWRWYRQYSGGAMADLGSHQVDVFNWFLKTPPRSVLASGGLDYFNGQGREWYDNVVSIYTYATPAGTVRGSYQVLNTTSHGGYYETFMGDEGSLVISEDVRKGLLYREVTAKRREWEDESQKIESMDREAIELKIGETRTAGGERTAEGQKLLEESQKDIHQLHLENFFNAIRGTATLTCPPEVGYETCVSVLRANDSVAAARELPFKPEDFVA